MNDDAVATCECRTWRQWRGNKNFPLWYDSRMNEWSLMYTTPEGLGTLIFTYCPFCGRAMPTSRRGDFFSKPDATELEEARSITVGIKSLNQLEAAIGVADHDFRWPEDLPPDPDVIPVRRQLTYSKRWRTLQLIVQEGPEGEIRFSIVGQYIPEGTAGDAA